MRIIQICPYDLSRPGGVRSHIMGLSQALVDDGHEVVIIGPDSSISSDHADSLYNSEHISAKSSKLGNFLDVYSEQRIEGNKSRNSLLDENSQATSIRYIKAKYRRKAIPLWGTQIDIAFADKSEKSQIMDFLRNWNPNVVHFHTPWTPFLSWQVFRLLKKQSAEIGSNPKLIATFHDSPPDSLIGSVLGKYVMPLVAKFLLPKFDEVISVSEPQSRFISKWTHKNIHIIPNGIRLEEDEEKVKWIPSKLILFLGRLESRKGLVHALEAYKLVKKRHPEVKMIVAGVGPQRLDGESFSRRYQLGIEFLGMVSEDKKNELLQNAGVFVSPALYGESFGIVLIEAMAKGVPVAGYGNPGYLSVVQGVCEENFPYPGDVTALAQALEKVLTDTGYALELSRKGYKHAQQYDWGIISRRIIKLYL